MDPRGMKLQEVGRKCVMRSLINFTLAKQN
jgi:hypothetical protein